MKIDITRKYQTRDGREVELWRDDLTSDLPVVGVVKDGCGIYTRHWYDDGRFSKFAETDADLIPIPQKRWAIISKDKKVFLQEDNVSAESITQIFKDENNWSATIEYVEGQNDWEICSAGYCVNYGATDRDLLCLCVHFR